MIRVAIADDHPEMRIALRLLLSLSPDIELVCESGNGKEAVDCVTQLQPDVLVMDIRMPEMDGLEATKQLADRAAGTRVILISSYDGRYMDMKAMGAGAKGYIPKDKVAESLLPAIKAVHSGETFFRE